MSKIALLAADPIDGDGDAHPASSERCGQREDPLQGAAHVPAIKRP
jgi:hypothetical protein